jgi:hypothetical protein
MAKSHVSYSAVKSDQFINVPFSSDEKSVSLYVSSQSSQTKTKTNKTKNLKKKSKKKIEKKGREKKK